MSTGAAHRAINQRPKRCPVCLLLLMACNLARHRRVHEREYGAEIRKRVA